MAHFVGLDVRLLTHPLWRRRCLKTPSGLDFPIIVIQEAGLDGFWIHGAAVRRDREPRGGRCVDPDLAPASAGEDRPDRRAVVEPDQWQQGRRDQ